MLIHLTGLYGVCAAQVMADVVGAVKALDADAAVKAIVLTGSGKAFAAGADIKEMVDLTEEQVGSHGG